MARMRLAQFLRDEHLNWPAQQLFARVSKHLFGHTIHQDNPAFLIHLQDGVRSGLKQSTETFIRQSVRLLGVVCGTSGLASDESEAIGGPRFRLLITSSTRSGNTRKLAQELPFWWMVEAGFTEESWIWGSYWVI